jgi:hypothetical protein
VHNAKLIRRHFPRSGRAIVLVALLISASLLAIGLGLLLLG